MKKLIIVFSLVLGLSSLSAHCQLPCGIYHDDLRFAMLEENVSTLKKAISEIQANNNGDAQASNQLVRAVNLKDEYADLTSHIFSFYFLQQRISPNSENLDALLLSSYKVLRLCAQIKASTDLAMATQLQSEIANFKELYKQKS